MKLLESSAGTTPLFAARPIALNAYNYSSETIAACSEHWIYQKSYQAQSERDLLHI
ncbi:MAG: hypothetical protein IPL73_23590 [Candidatus Obscuribacter sp.]|nr:hypothetical protein [Candidatus Obscuribacter sp.]